MTNRRSMQTGEARMSRQTQFVPGHVGGRVASAQPVRYRNHVGGVAAPVGTPPNSVTYFQAGDATFSPYAGGTLALPLTPSAGDSVIALVATRSVSGMAISVPSGWREMASGSAGSYIRWRLLAIDVASGSETLAFPIASGTGDGPLYGLIEYRVSGWKFSGSKGGIWEHVLGPEASAASLTYVAPDPGWDVFAQIGLYGGLWTVFDSYPPGAATESGTLLGSMDNAETGFASTAWAGTYTYTGLGAYGPPGTRSLAIGWRP